MENRKLITGVIYCYTNKINGKKYIGQTTDERKRKYQHKGKQGCSVFHNAINKYGWEIFKYEVLSRKQYVNEEDASFDLDLLEIYYIDKFDTFNNGYNSTYGGESNRGYKLTMEQRNKLIEIHKGKHEGTKNYFYGRKHTEETKELIASHNPRIRKVYQIEIDTDKIIKIWDRIKFASDELGIAATHITRVCKGKRKTAGGYKWKYKES